MSHTHTFTPVTGSDPYKADKPHRNRRDRRRVRREEQGLLLSVPLIRQPRRVLMHHIDAGPGNPNGAVFRCGKCDYLTGWLFDVTNEELRRGRPCPVCNVEVAS